MNSGMTKPKEKAKMTYEKLAALLPDIKLRPHQQRIADDESPSKIIAHGVGSGKTLSAISKFERMKEKGLASKALVVVPAGLRNNFEEEGVKKFTDSTSNVIGTKTEIKSGKRNAADPNADYNIVSYEMFRQNPEGLINELGVDTLIYDEAHKGKNEGTLTTKAIQESRPLVKNYTGLTGSVISNSIADVQPLYLAATGGKQNLGKDKKSFEKMFLKRSDDPKYKYYSEKRTPVTGLKNKNVLKRELKGIIDYLSPKESTQIADMPEKEIGIVKVPITKDQAKFYKGILDDNPGIREMIRTKRLETLKDDEAAKAYNAMIEARKLMNSVGSVKKGIPLEESAKITPKTNKLLNDLERHLGEDPMHQALIMSHLINGGTDVIEAGLQDRGIDYGKFLGKGNVGVTEESRQQDVRDYNDRKKRVMVISSAGGEGLSLGDTTWEGILDPHYNPEKMKQMEARGIRSGGLADREDRTVYVDRYVSTMPKTLGIFPSRTRTPDEFIYEIANQKEKQNNIFFDFLDDIKDKRRKKTAMNYEDLIEKVAKSELNRYQLIGAACTGIEDKIMDEENFSEEHRDSIRSLVSNSRANYDFIDRILDEVNRRKGIDLVEFKEKKASGYQDLIEKLAKEKEQIMYHASPVQEIKKFRKSEDKSGQNHGKVIFGTPDPSFAAAFGAKWNDGNAKLTTKLKNTKPPTTENYKSTELKVTDEVDLDKPCSMYKLKGKFKDLRYSKDLEKVTKDDVEIVEEKKFDSVKEMMKEYGVKLKKVEKKHIIKKLDGQKTSNFEKKASDYQDLIEKLAETDEDKIKRNPGKFGRAVVPIAGATVLGGKLFGDKIKNEG